MNLRRMLAIAAKETIHVRRDRPTLAMLLILPAFMILMFGYAVTTDVRRVPAAVWDDDGGPAARELVEKLRVTGYFDFRYRVAGLRELRELMDAGRIRIGLVLPPGFSRQVTAGRPAVAQLVVDGSDPLVAQTVLPAAQMTAQAHGLALLQARLYRSGADLSALEPPVELRARVWYNPDLESRRFNLPGLVGTVLQNLVVLLTAFALVRERERGTFEQLLVTPIRPVELMVGKLLPYVVLGFVAEGVTLALIIGWFGVVPGGSVVLLVALSGFFLLCTLSMGLLISTVAANQLQAMQMTFGLVNMPSFILSGFIFPRESMPTVIQWLGNAVPLTYFLRILRGVVVKGVGLTPLWPDVAALALYAVVLIALASFRFRRTLD